MALCDIHVAGCGEHPPAWGLRDDRIAGTDQAVRGGRHGQKLHSGFPHRKVDARGSADARSSAEAGLSWQKVQRREANRRCHRLTEPTTKALCQPPPPPQPPAPLPPHLPMCDPAQRFSVQFLQKSPLRRSVSLAFVIERKFGLALQAPAHVRRGFYLDPHPKQNLTPPLPGMH